MICEMCGKDGARQRLLTRSYGKNESLLVIEDVPVIFCPNCGERYMTAETLDHIERIKSSPKTLATKRLVTVAVFK
ncbi:type II toxin-antitoxin system MqsA family antitoxin [Candidatus Poribacteria bacterium]|nr:type II toxin-antitoxin system MqsA family antitoxin [Candidatus Poribacteria bacterium]